MRDYFIRRLLLVPLTLLGITLLVFMLIRLAPGGPVQRDLKEMTNGAGSEQGGVSGMRESEGVAITPEQLFEIEEKHRREKGVWRSYLEWLGVLPRDTQRVARSLKIGRLLSFKLSPLSPSYALLNEIFSSHTTYYQMAAIRGGEGEVQEYSYQIRLKDPSHKTEKDLKETLSKIEGISEVSLAIQRRVSIPVPGINFSIDLVKDEAESGGIRIEIPAQMVDEKRQIRDNPALSEEEKKRLVNEIEKNERIVLDRIKDYEWKVRLVGIEELKRRWNKNNKEPYAANKLKMPGSDSENPAAVGKWHKQKGEEVLKGDVLATIEIDKVSSELKAPVAGVIRGILVEQGEEVAAGTVIAEIDVLQERAVLFQSKRDGLMQGSLGKSDKYQDPVIGLVKDRIPISLFYGLISMILIYGICIPLGIVKAIKHRTWLDNVSSIAVFSGYAIPGYVLGSFLLVFLGARLDLFPLSGFVSEGFSELTPWAKLIDLFHHAVMPLACYLVGSFAFMTFMMKNNLMDNLAADYVRTATAKGVSYSSAVFKHAFRNSIIPIATTVGQNITLIVGGSFLIEGIFDINGFGLLQYNAILEKDEPVVLGVLTISATLMLLGNVISDLCVALVDPRIRFR